jgi:hypothetical protein
MQIACIASLVVIRLAAQAPLPDKPLLSDYVNQNVTDLPPALHLDPVYRKYADALGIPIVSSDKVPDAALLVARDIVIHMPDDLKNYDPKPYELLSRLYPHHHIPMDVYYGKEIKPRRPADQKKDSPKRGRQA